MSGSLRLRVVRVPITLYPNRILGCHQKMTWRHLTNVLEQGSILIHRQEQILKYGLVIPACGNAGCEQGLYFRGQVKLPPNLGIVQRLDAEAVARGEEFSVSFIPEDECEFAPQPLQAIGSQILVEVQCDLAIGAGVKPVAGCFQVMADSFEIVEFSINHNVELLILVGNRLSACWKGR